MKKNKKTTIKILNPSSMLLHSYYVKRKKIFFNKKNFFYLREKFFENISFHEDENFMKMFNETVS
jgi:hypothetical protein